MLLATVTCVITSHKDPARMIQNMMKQDYSAKQLVVVGSNLDKELKREFPLCNFMDVPNRKDWGYTKRGIGLALGEGEYVCFCNEDDIYNQLFLTKLVGAIKKEKVDMAYCVWRDRDIGLKAARAVLQKSGMTSGNFVVKTELAQSVGWRGREYAADWDFIKSLLDKGIKTTYIAEALLVHL